MNASLHQQARSRGRRGLGASGTCLAQQHWPCLYQENVSGSKQQWHSIFLLSCTLPSLVYFGRAIFISAPTSSLEAGVGVQGIWESPALRGISQGPSEGALAGPWGLGLDGRSSTQL